MWNTGNVEKNKPYPYRVGSVFEKDVAVSQSVFCSRSEQWARQHRAKHLLLGGAAQYHGMLIEYRDPSAIMLLGNCVLNSSK